MTPSGATCPPANGHRGTDVVSRVTGHRRGACDDYDVPRRRRRRPSGAARRGRAAAIAPRQRNNNSNCRGRLDWALSPRSGSTHSPSPVSSGAQSSLSGGRSTGDRNSVMLGAAPFAASGCLLAIRDPRQLRALPASSLDVVVGLPTGHGRRIAVLRHGWPLSSRARLVVQPKQTGRTRHARNIAEAALPCERWPRASLARTPWRRVAATGANLGGSSAATTREGALCCTGPGATLVKLETLAPPCDTRGEAVFSERHRQVPGKGNEGGGFSATRLIRDTGRLRQTRRSGFDSEENMTYPGHPADPLFSSWFHSFPPGHHERSCSRYRIFVDVR
ncbi:hypothetical protein MRX96_012521 [Rhipicephalus microplus]